MPETSAHKAAHNADVRLTLRSRLVELSLVRPWVDALALKYSIPSDTRYAIDLCLEEALSNVIRHGYAGEPDHVIIVDCALVGTGWLNFIIEDSAPPFSPSEADDFMPSSPRATPDSIEDFKVRGHGIDLMRHFAGSLAWEQLLHGNRLTIGFRIAPPSQL